jgi:hypothetical protein
MIDAIRRGLPMFAVGYGVPVSTRMHLFFSATRGALAFDLLLPR